MWLVQCKTHLASLPATYYCKSDDFAGPGRWFCTATSFNVHRGITQSHGFPPQVLGVFKDTRHPTTKEVRISKAVLIISLKITLMMCEQVENVYLPLTMMARPYDQVTIAAAATTNNNWCSSSSLILISVTIFSSFMPRILPRLLEQIERQANQQQYFDFKLPKKGGLSLYKPVPPAPSFHPKDHERSILLSPGSPVTESQQYARHKRVPPSQTKPGAADQAMIDPPRQMTREEFGWWGNPYCTCVFPHSEALGPLIYLYAISENFIFSNTRLYGDTPPSTLWYVASFFLSYTPLIQMNRSSCSSG